jgi:hypothetical protein
MSKKTNRKLTGLLPEFPVVLRRLVASLFELERRVNGQLLAGRLAERFGPLGLARILLLLEVLVAF